MDERDKKAREILRQEVGITDEDFEKWRQNPRNYFFLDNMPILRQYQLVAEVLSSRNCTAQLKPGQKLVFELMPAVLQKDSTAPGLRQGCRCSCRTRPRLLEGDCQRQEAGRDRTQGNRLSGPRS